MSRFGLRSCTDGLKFLEEKNVCRKGSNFTLISTKRFTQPKDVKFSTHAKNEENLIEGIKIEPDETDKGSDTSERLTKNKNRGCGDDDDDDDEDNDNDNDNNDDDDYKQPSSRCKGTLICSLPLDRVNEIIEKLNLNKSKIENDKDTDDTMIDDTLDNDDDEEDDANISKQSASNTKNLCLYCDRKFSSHKMQLKHVDKFHCLQQDRRCSGRNSNIQQQQQPPPPPQQQQQPQSHQSQILPRKRKSTIGQQIFRGCNFCQKAKGQSQPVILPATELSSLFVHLTDCHTDKYFGCKICVIRFPNMTKLSKHMEVVHKNLSVAFDENSSKSKDNDTDSIVPIEKLTIGERSKFSLKRHQRMQKSPNSYIAISANAISTITSTPQCSTAINSVIGAEEPILSRLGLTQNRLPNNRKGVRLRREKLIPEMLLKSEQNHTSSTNYTFGPNTSLSASSTCSTTCSSKLRSKSIKTVSGFSGDTAPDVIFRVPTRNDILSCVFDDNFYKEVVSNVRNNLLFHLDGKIMGNSAQQLDTSLLRHAHQPQIRSTLVKSPIVVTTLDSEIHAATSLSAITAFPTLLTADQFGGDVSSSKIRRPHTKNSWKWKWDSVKKFKLINEGGKIIKKMKHPMLGLRDLSKLDMWTQLMMRQKHEFQQQQKNNVTFDNTCWNSSTTATDISSDVSREEKQRINDQLNFILDMRLLPHIILEQNEQAIIKVENDEFGITPAQISTEDCGDSFMEQTFADDSFLSMLNLLPSSNLKNTHTKIVLSGEWARPRCYLCICCGAKFEKLKSLEEHKMFRHSQILSTHYEVVGRELLNGNLLRHLFIPKKALSRYGNSGDNNLVYGGAARRLFWHKNEILIREIANNDESSDSLQSVLNSCATNSPSLKNNSSSTDDCDIDTKMSTTISLQLIGNTEVVSPTYSIQSCSSSSSTGVKKHLKISTLSRSLPTVNTNANHNSSSCGSSNNSNNIGSSCSKCGRKCNGVLDLYRHMLDCSGDYIWSLAKKRKYRYYCGSKKRRPCNKHSILELRKNKNKTVVKPLSISNDNTTDDGTAISMNFTKTKNSPRSRPSDAESIKKMLENLPPKRICKKIFPTLNKAKKSIKPNLLAKHKIYNNLRKTRVRQISQAAKILSKTKSQLKKPKKMPTRSVSSIPPTIKNRKHNKQENVKAIINKNSEVKVPENEVYLKNNKLEEYMDEVDFSSTRAENKNSMNPLINETFKNKENDDSDQPLKTSRELVLSQEKDVQIQEAAILKKNINLIEKSENQSTDVNSTISIHKMVQPEIQMKETSNNIDKSSASFTRTSSKSERNIQINNKSVKRSKRISDCIAMLTGKLEEKLKTEQKTLVTTSQETIVSSVIPQSLKTHTPTIPFLSVPCKQLAVLTKPLEDIDNEKYVLKKIPKRKAICRKLIKSDVPESSIIPDLTTNFESKPHDNSKTMKPTEIKASAVEHQMTNTSTIQEIAPTIQTESTTPSMKTTLSELVFSKIEKRKLTNLNTTSSAGSMPLPIMPLNTSALMPKVPLYIPLDNLRQPIPSPHINPLPIPMSLPVPVPVPISIENAAQAPSVSISATVGIANTTILTTPVIPIMTSVPAHLAVQPALKITVPSFNTTNTNTEPLNLSNSSKNIQKQSQDLSCIGSHRVGGIPARRQTICGFEVRNFAIFDEMEPLDLSKKARPEKTNPAVPISSRHIEMSSLLLPVQNTLGTPSDSSVLTLPPLTPEALLNKPFYSNLDLLRIPQVRNPTACQIPTPSNETAQPPPVSINNNPVIPPFTKVTNKKRNKHSSAHLTSNTSGPIASTSTECTVSNTSTIATKSNITKDTTTNTVSKRELSSKNKTALRMDEEVINHIDDAINSVINAVKASLDSEEAQRTQEMILKQSQTSTTQTIKQLKTTDDVDVAKESVAEFKYLTAARRNMRSKTLDCRPPALSKPILKNPSIITVNINQGPDNAVVTALNTATSTPQATKNNENVKSDTRAQVYDLLTHVVATEKDKIETGTETETYAVVETEMESQKKIDIQEKNLEFSSKHLEKSVDDNITKGIEIGPEAENVDRHINVIAENSRKDVTPKPLVENIEIPVVPSIGQTEDLTDRTIINTITTNNISLDLEQMSNNNNTSSGFHSSAQSDQQTSVMSTTTSAVSVSGTGSDAKKKQRRRRKNELAAIVADQLLESFKLDKARRDNLKKLENLAYEKSEDLLLTGMLLMSSTKRNATLSSSITTNVPVENIESIANNKRTGKIQRNNLNVEFHKQNDISVNENKTVVAEGATIEKSLGNEKDSLEVLDLIDDKKSVKRRQYRRRGKNLDNENISKLKSSLESFSIDIERQLTEYEAKNVNAFKNVANDAAKQSCSLKNQTAANVNKPSIVLRPSILSMTIESGANQENLQNTTKTVANDTNKTVVSSRDPRLNKNIHKEGKKNNEVSGIDAEKEIVLMHKCNSGPEEIGELDEDNYLTEIAKNVNEKIMSTENEEFAFKDDGFEMVNDLGIDDSNSKFSRPPTSMSVRSAPNFNDDRSNFGSICDENTNTEVMDMDLDDEMSVYTSYSQDLGRNRGRRRRRRRSFLLTRKPKKRASSRDMSADKIECILCKKVFYSANSLSKHNMTLAHVSKVSEQEYLLSKSRSNISSLANAENLQTFGSLGPYARRTTRRSTISELPMQSRCDSNLSPPMQIIQNSVIPLSNVQLPKTQTSLKSSTIPDIDNIMKDSLEQINPNDAVRTTKPLQKSITKYQIPDNEYDGNINANTTFNGNSRLNLNPDERLFFECCNILKSAETPRISSGVSTAEDCDINTNYAYSYNNNDKSTHPNTNVNRSSANTIHPNHHQIAPPQIANNNLHTSNHQQIVEQQTLSRDPQLIHPSSCYNKPVHDNRNARSPTHSAISHLSAVTNTTSRFKTKAAMKGYENVNIDLNQQQESKSRTICKLTELAEIALGNEGKPNSHVFSPIQSSLTPPQALSHQVHYQQLVKANTDTVMRSKSIVIPEYGTTLVTEIIRECNAQFPIRSERTKNNETRSSTSSKTIMHSSIIKAAVEEHQKAQTSNKIIIPDRPFKNIGLEEKESITFQKPKTPAVNLLTEDNNSVSTGSFSDRDDYDFGSLSCDDEVSVRGSNDKNQKNNSSESSSESSRATAKTFENKSLIMGRIFKNASTKAANKNTVNAVKVKSVGVQKDHTPAPKADLNQLFDELRGNSGADGGANDRLRNSTVDNNGIASVTTGNSKANLKQHQQQREILTPIIPAASPPAVVSSTTATPSTNVRKVKPRISRPKSNVGSKTRKDISKLQTELGMSQDEIKKLIDEGQRKSKRRCATNRPKKLVEMWSSDEYEEFLSTKDIFALIEEKEQQEKRKKRKNIASLPIGTSEAAKEKDLIPDVTSSTKDLKRRNTRRMSMAAERTENILLDRDELLSPKNTKNNKKSNYKKEEPVSTTAYTTNANELGTSPKFAKPSPEKIKIKKTKKIELEDNFAAQLTNDNNNINRRKRLTNSSTVNKSKSKPPQKAKKVKVTKESTKMRTKYKNRQYDDGDESNGDVNSKDDEDVYEDDDDDFLISELKDKQNGKTRRCKVKNGKAMASTSTAIVTSTANAKLSVSTHDVVTKKRAASNNCNNNCSNANVGTSSGNLKSQQHNQQLAKSKRKNESNKSSPRRKRLATEKLYYWSSSSDEEFGRINSNKINPPPDNYESGGEQYQKHGWIVGDSHKKLVTLLAIAKGNKKVDSNSGVKKNVAKKRN